MNQQATSTQPTVPPGFRVVVISREPIELYKILKFESLVGSGGEAKAAVASGQVLVNGSIETQKRKQIVTGDTIEFGAEKIFIKLGVPVTQAPQPGTAHTSAEQPPITQHRTTRAKPAPKKQSVNRQAIAISKGTGQEKGQAKGKGKEKVRKTGTGKGKHNNARK